MKNEIVILVLALFAALLFCLVIVNKAEWSLKKIDRIVIGIGDKINKKKETLFYKNYALFLKEKGAKFHFGENFTPEKMILIQGILFIAGSLISLNFARELNVFTCIFAMVLVGSFFAILPVIIILSMNKSDNEKMLADIKLIFNSLAVWINAGMNINDALGECYNVVQNDRLKLSFLSLAGDIVLKADMDTALVNFNSQFDNPYIDSLCIIVSQANESGRALDSLGDINESVKDMEIEIATKKKASLDRKVTFMQLIILGAMLMVILYASVTHMFNEGTMFMN